MSYEFRLDKRRLAAVAAFGYIAISYIGVGGAEAEPIPMSIEINTPTVEPLPNPCSATLEQQTELNAESCQRIMDIGAIAIVDYSRRSDRSEFLAKIVEESLLAVTQGEVSPTVTFITPSKEAQQRHDKLLGQECLDTHVHSLADISRQSMPDTINSFDYTISVTPMRSCKPIGGAAWVSMSYAEVYSSERPLTDLASTTVHEAGHLYGLSHAGSLDYFIYGADYKPTTTRDLLSYTDEDYYDEYRDWTVMGNRVNGKTLSSPLNGVHLYQLAWTDRVLGKNGAIESIKLNEHPKDLTAVPEPLCGFVEVEPTEACQAKEVLLELKDGQTNTMAVLDLLKPITAKTGTERDINDSAIFDKLAFVLNHDLYSEEDVLKIDLILVQAGDNQNTLSLGYLFGPQSPDLKIKHHILNIGEQTIEVAFDGETVIVSDISK